MAFYVDGFVLPVPKKNVKLYTKAAKICAKVWLEHGALQYVECCVDDVQKGSLTSFPLSVKLKSNEVVFFSWITYKSKADRKRVVAKVMQDPRVLNIDPNIFDSNRMIYGGFKPAVIAGK